MFPPYHPVNFLVVENDPNDGDKSQNGDDKGGQESRTETTPTTMHEAPEQGTENKPKEAIPTVSEPVINLSRLTWLLPPSAIHDGRLFRKVG